jgi:predicted nucleotidyltransferase
MSENTIAIDIDDLITKLQPVFQRYPVQKVILFGSFARNEASRRSDIEWFTRFDPRPKLSKQDGQQATSQAEFLLEACKNIIDEYAK